MSNNIALVDAEMVAALKVLRGDNGKKDANALDKEFTGTLARQIVDAVSSQKEESSSQTAELLAAVKEQTRVLQKLTELMQAQSLRKPASNTVVVVHKERDTATATPTGTAISSGASIGGATAETDDITEDPTIIAALAAAANYNDQASVSTTEAVVTMPTPTTTTTPAPPKPVSEVRGPWTFVESEDAAKRRSRALGLGFKGLFGTPSGGELSGNSFGEMWSKMKSRVDQYGKLKAPKWSVHSKESVRTLLPTLTIDGKTKFPMNSGIYYLTIRYVCDKELVSSSSSDTTEAAIVIGEIAFDHTGSVLAPGAKWANLLKGQKQKEPPSAATAKPKWYSAKVTDRWQDGDVVRFKVDTDTKSVVYTLTAAGAKEAKAGWRFDNVLTFTNAPTFPNEFRAFAYCGGKGGKEASSALAAAVKFEIVDETKEEAQQQGKALEANVEHAAPPPSPPQDDEDDDSTDSNKVEAEVEAAVEAETEAEAETDPAASTKQ